jgi:hypothetical protein
MILRLLLVAALSFSTAALADFNLVGRSTLTALNLANQGREALYVKKHLMRRDLIDRGRSYSYLYDLKKKELAVVDHFMRQVEVHTLAAGKDGKAGAPRVNLAATGRRHTLSDWNCEEHTLEARLPGEMGQEKVTVVLTGLVWLERKAGERKEVAPFVQAVQADDFFVGAALPGKPGNSQALELNEVLRQVLLKGMLCAAEIRLDYEGTGPMADLGRRMATKASIVYESLSDQPIKDDLFAIPVGYRETKR